MRRLQLWVLGTVLAAAGAWAQQTSGTVKGVLMDDSGAVIPAAKVSLSGGGGSKIAQTQADGSYTFAGLAPGSYTVSVAFPGFNTFSKEVTVNAGSSVQLPIQLAISSEKQEVTVQEESTNTVSVEPDNNATALVIKGSDLEALPDDPDDLSDALQALAGPGAGPNGGQIYIDGFSGGQLPPKESIREIRINQNPFSAEFDRLGFGRIEILTKPGTDKLRGAVSLFDIDSIFDSRNPLVNNKPDYSNRQISANLGSAINKKASFFVDFNRRDIENNSIVVAEYFSPTTLTQSNINTAVLTPSSFTVISPRIDYALSGNNTLTVRMEERFNSQDNAGLGGANLPAPYSELAYNSQGDAQNVMVTETSVLSAKVVNETRLQFTRNWSIYDGNQIPQINVAGAFVTGGNGRGDQHDLSTHYELQNFTQFLRGTHTVKAGVRVRRNSDRSNQPQGFNGTFTFLGGVEPALDANNNIEYDSSGNPLTVTLTSLEQYERQLMLANAGYNETQIQALGGGPSRFSIQAGQSYISRDVWDVAPYVQDDWRFRPNLTISLGLRYETQTLIDDRRDWAPRIGFAWAPGTAKNSRQKTVIRGGFGIFYDRVSSSLFENAALNNGTAQVDYTVYNPIFYPVIPSPSSLNAGQNLVYRVDPNLRADYSLQSAIGVERQLPRNTTMAVTFTNNRAVHMQQTIPINTPLPGSFNPQLALSATNGVFPYGYAAGNIFEYESGGHLNQKIMMVNFNTRFSPRVSLFGNYALTYAKDLPSSPTDPYDFALDYGRSNLDRRNNFQLVGSVVGPSMVRFAPFVTVRSGQPYDVLLGQDVFGDTETNARAAFASNATCATVVRSGNNVCSPYGTFTSYTVGSSNTFPNLVPRNYLTMPGLVSINLRIYRVFGFGPVRGNAAQPGGGGFGGGRGGYGGGGRGGGGMRMGPGGGGRGGMGGDTTEHRYNVTLSVNLENLLNHFNPAGYQGTITNPLFLQPTSVNTGFGGGFGGAGSSANNRRIQMGLRFTF
ncbi:MAG: carboxypeptidase regulatory-like domain-containing protein [Bryobacteraceae bacterium]